MSSFAYTNSLTISLGTNATTSSTPAYACCPITFTSKSLSFMTLAMPYANLVEAY
jgi:hypothetical protein